MKVKVQFQNEEKLIDQGLLAVEELYKMAECGENRIFLCREDDIDIPLKAGEFLVIHGDEQFVLGSSDIENNPPLRKPLNPEFNGQRTISFPRAKISGKSLKEQDEKLSDGRLFVDITGGVDEEIEDEMQIVVQDADSYFVIPAAEDDVVDVEECGKHDRPPPKVDKYRIRIDGDKFVVDSTSLNGAAILALVGKETTDWFLNQKLHGGKRVRIKPEDTVDFAQPGVERFETVRQAAQQGDE